MTTSTSPSKLFSDHDDPQLTTARKLHPLAFVALLLGFLSTLAYAGVVYWGLAGIGMLGCVLILMFLQRRKSVCSGQNLAIAGLLLTIVMATFAPTEFFSRRYRIGQQANVVGKQWIDSILRDEAYVALAATEEPTTRLVKKHLDKFYRDDDDRRKRYESFVNGKRVRTLIALNGSARVRFYATEKMNRTDKADEITNVYAVTYLETPTVSKTFFVRLTIERTDRRDTTTGFWKIMRPVGGVKPRPQSYFW